VPPRCPPCPCRRKPEVAVELGPLLPDLLLFGPGVEAEAGAENLLPGAVLLGGDGPHGERWLFHGWQPYWGRRGVLIRPRPENTFGGNEDRRPSRPAPRARRPHRRPPGRSQRGCVVTPTGIDCSAAGSSTSGGTTPGGSIPGLPSATWPPPSGPAPAASAGSVPLPARARRLERQQRPGHLADVVALPECPDPEAPVVTLSTEWVIARAWEIFRSFPLAAPRPFLQPPTTGSPACPPISPPRAPRGSPTRRPSPTGAPWQSRHR